MSASSEGNASAVARQVAVGRFKPTLSLRLRMAVVSELDSAAGLEGWSISTRWILLIAPAVYAAGSPHWFPPRVRGQARTWETFAAEVTPAARTRAPTHVELGARDAATGA
jgi:hypothetical protein